MWLQSIGKQKVLLWLWENGRQLRTTVIVFGVLVCVNVVLYIFMVAPSEAWLKKSEAMFAGFRSRRAEAMLYEKQKPLFAGILNGIPAQKDMPLLVKELVLTARRQNLSVASINYDIPRRESGEIALLSFSFPVEGKYPDLKRFIYEVESSDRLIGIQEAKLESDQGNVKMQMKLITYVRGK